MQSSFISYFPPHRYIQPICLPGGRHSRRTFENALPVALGWGVTHYGGEEVGRLQAVALPVWSNSKCDEAYFQVGSGVGGVGA